MTAILTTDGRVYVTGRKVYTGFGSHLTEFTQYPQFKDQKKIIKQISSSYRVLIFQTEDNEIWVTCHFIEYGPLLRKLIDLTDSESSFNLVKDCSQYWFFLLRNELISYLSQDLGKLLENGYFSDCKIQNIPVHKILIETRLENDFDKISNYLEESKLKEIQDLLKWVYCDEIRNHNKKTLEILYHFGIESPQKTKLLKNDLEKLLVDKETSDFTLVIQKNKNDKENQNQNGNVNKNDKELEEELHIHKFILAARSDFFLFIFQNVDQNIKKLKDYSKFSLDAIKLLIKFLYTDEIILTVDTDKELIRKEFLNISDYYQLNPNIPLLNIFDRCDKK
ncbi:hypothetical protein M0812_27843 [Anaeramoeba flamelloides]|uniref:BTB domain-containing protein n=1 Tax=Anaeramoeba flamelloides TaxID=1746091 RepID=A0AAV7YCY4_9EUKA|nr:hypothetical protein M0812_27843 [Anaeramoeba flamelloides]